MTIPQNPDALLCRRDTAQALTESGYPTPPATLATMACRGDGPPYHKYGRAPLYRWEDALAWAKSRLSEARTSTSEHDTSANNFGLDGAGSGGLA
jgi:hypothetical protein